MTGNETGADSGDYTPIERLLDVADAIFDRAIKLEGIKLAKKDDEASKTISETKDDAFGGVIKVWKVVLLLLPKSDLEQSRRKELRIDAYKVISRCYHRLGNLEGARNKITKAIDEGYADGFISLGAICLDLKEYDDAESAFQSAIAKDAQATRAHAGLGELYFAKGTQKLKTDPGHTEFFAKAEEEFVMAGKARFTEGFDRAMDLFETMGWKDRALSIGERAAGFYGENKGKYGEKLLTLNRRVRKLAGEERHDRIVKGVGRKLGTVLGGKKE